MAAIVLLMPACDSERLNQFSTFAAAGSQYVLALHQLIAQAGSAMIAADSATLVTARNLAGPGLSENAAGFRKSVAAEDRLLETYLGNLQRIDAHATLLGAYFDAVSKLTNGKEASSMATSTASLLDSVKAFAPTISDAKFAGKPVSDYVQSGASVVVAHFEVKALNDELKNAPVIDQALALQEAAIECIGEQMRTSLQASLKVRESTDVIDPYIQAGPLPANWNSTREALLRTKVTVESADSAQSAIKKLRAAFRDLAANKATVSLADLEREVNKMAGYVSAVEASHK
jgi:hypothetical protein